VTIEWEIPQFARRLLALALLLAPLAAIAYIAASYASDVIAQRQRLSLLERQRARYTALIHDGPGWKAELGHLRHAMAGGPLFYAGKTLNDDVGQMQAVLGSVIAAAGGSNVQNRVAIQANGEDGPVELHADAAFSADTGQLLKILYRLHQARPVLLPTSLEIHPAEAGQLSIGLRVMAYASAQ
jgi:hypothetical protein